MKTELAFSLRMEWLQNTERLFTTTKVFSGNPDLDQELLSHFDGVVTASDAIKLPCYPAQGWIVDLKQAIASVTQQKSPETKPKTIKEAEEHDDVDQALERVKQTFLNNPQGWQLPPI